MIKKTEGANIWSKCEWYQHEEKPIKFFMNLEKQKSVNTIVRDLIEVRYYIPLMDVAQNLIFITSNYICLVQIISI